MPNWNEVIVEILEEQKKNPSQNAVDTIRRKYLKKVSEISGRNTIAVLTTHHAFMHTFLSTPSIKIIENHIGVAYIEQAVQSTNQ